MTDKTETLADRLESCPFCKGEPDLHSVSLPMDYDCADVYVSCSKCDAQGPSILFDQGTHTVADIHDLEDEAIAACNTRAQPASDDVAGLVANVREAFALSTDPDRLRNGGYRNTADVLETVPTLLDMLERLAGPAQPDVERSAIVQYLNDEADDCMVNIEISGADMAELAVQRAAYYRQAAAFIKRGEHHRHDRPRPAPLSQPTQQPGADQVEAAAKAHCDYFGGDGWWDTGLLADTKPKALEAMRAALTALIPSDPPASLREEG